VGLSQTLKQPLCLKSLSVSWPELPKPTHTHREPSVTGLLLRIVLPVIPIPCLPAWWPSLWGTASSFSNVLIKCRNLWQRSYSCSKHEDWEQLVSAFPGNTNRAFWRQCLPFICCHYHLGLGRERRPVGYPSLSCRACCWGLESMTYLQTRPEEVTV
jgi:hypothetical protein